MAYQRPFVRVQKLHEYTGHKAPVFGLCSDKQGNFFSASGDGLIAKWDSQSLSDAKALFQAFVPFYTVNLLNNFILACGASNGIIYFYHLKNQNFIKSVQAHEKSIFQILPISQDVFLSIGGDGVLNLWDTISLTIQKKIAISHQSLRTIFYDPQQKRLFIGASDSKIRAFELHDVNLLLLKEWKAHEPSVFSLIGTPQYPYLISAGRDASIRVWNSHNFELIYEIPAHIQTINHLQLSPDASYLLSVSMDKLIKLWDIHHDFRLIKVIDKNRNDSHTASVNHVLWLDYNDSIISCSDDKKIIQWAIDINPQDKE